MAINYNDSRFTELSNEKNNALNQSNNTYDNLINQSSSYYDNLINQNKENADKQAEIQNQQTEFTVQKIEQQKEKAEKDYTKEQKGAYQDYMKQSNAYGSSNQTMGQQGLSGSGWSETIQSGYYNTYQNRYAQARESYNEIVMNYNNNIKEAELQNNSALAQIYANAQQEQLELALQSFTVIKDLTLAKQNNYQALDNEYNNRWRQIESQINTENALAEQIRQYNASLALQKQQLEQEKSSLSSGSSSDSTILNPYSNSNNNSPVINDISEMGKYAQKVGKVSSGTVKLSNGKIGYSSVQKAYSAYGGSLPYSESTLLKKGLVKQITYNGKTYYYA